MNNILLIEDIEVIHKLYSHQLISKYWISPKVYTNLHTAKFAIIEALEAKQSSIIILDWNFPDRDNSSPRENNWTQLLKSVNKQLKDTKNQVLVLLNSSEHHCNFIMADTIENQVFNKNVSYKITWKDPDKLINEISDFLSLDKVA